MLGNLVIGVSGSFTLSSLTRVVRFLSFAACTSAFEEVRNQIAAGGQERPSLTTPDACKQGCIEMFPHCVAIDFFDRKCFIHDKESFKHANLENKNGATQYLVKPC